MRVIWNKMPRPRLLNSVVPYIPESTEPDENSESRFRHKGAGILSGSSRWLFVGILAGAFVFQWRVSFSNGRATMSPPCSGG